MLTQQSTILHFSFLPITRHWSNQNIYKLNVSLKGFKKILFRYNIKLECFKLKFSFCSSLVCLAWILAFFIYLRKGLDQAADFRIMDHKQIGIRKWVHHRSRIETYWRVLVTCQYCMQTRHSARATKARCEVFWVFVFMVILTLYWWRRTITNEIDVLIRWHDNKLMCTQCHVMTHRSNTVFQWLQNVC